MRKVISMKFKVIMREGEDGWCVVEIPALSGCISQGKNTEEALENIKEAIELYLEPDDNVISTVRGLVAEVVV